MKNLKPLIFFLFISFLLFTGMQCKKNDLEIIPKKAILGKWELKKSGTSLDKLNEVTPTGYKEYLNDSVYRFYDYKTKTFTNGDYAINDSMIVNYYYASNGNKVDTISVSYYYTFKDSRTMILDIDALAILDFFVYEKIN